MKRRKKIRLQLSSLLELLDLIFLVILIFLITFGYQFEKLSVNPPAKLTQLEKYFLKKNLAQILLNLPQAFKENPELVELKVSFNFWQKEIKLEAKSGEVVAKIEDARNNKIFYLDTYGRINSNFKPSDEILTIISYKSIKDNSLLHPTFQKFFSLLFEFSNFYNFPLKKIIIYSNSDIAVYSEQNQEFLFDPYKDQKEQLKKLLIFLNYQKEKNLKNISRIDLRIPSKIYFK